MKKRKAKTSRLPNYDYSPLAESIGNKCRKLRQATGKSIQETARALGCVTGYWKRVEEGKILPTSQLATRFVEFAFANKSWSETPTLPVEVRGSVPGEAFRLLFNDKALYDRLKDFSAAGGYSMTAVILTAIERFLDNEPTLVTIKKAVEVAESLRLRSILSATPSYVQILEGDPLVAQLVHETRPVTPVWAGQWNRGLETIKGWDEAHDGPSTKTSIEHWVKKLERV